MGDQVNTQVLEQEGEEVLHLAAGEVGDHQEILETVVALATLEEAQIPDLQQT